MFCNNSGALRAPAYLFTILVWAYALAWALAGHPIYRDQHLGAALQFANKGIDLLRPVIVGFNASGTGTPQEFPIWQALAALGIQVSNGWWGGATIVSLLLFSASLPAFYALAKSEAGLEAGWIALALLLSQPIVFQLAGGAQTDGLSLALMLGFLWSADLLRRRPSWRNFSLCSFLTVALAVTKLPFLVASGIAAALLLFWNNEKPSQWLQLIFAGLIALTIFFVWNQWCDDEIGRAIFKYRPMTMRENPEWFFGNLDFRLNPANYIKAGWRALSCLYGSFVLIALTAYGLWLKPKSLGSALLVGALGVTLLFTKIILVHRHYFLLYSPAIALLNTYTVNHALKRSNISGRRLLVATGVASSLLLLSIIQGLVQIEALSATADTYVKTIASVIKDYTHPDEKFVIINGGWGGDVLIHSGRNGLSADSPGLVENPEHLAQLRELGYTKLVIVSDSPLLHALQLTNPGSRSLKRILWQDFMTEKSRTWPTIFQNEDIMIKELPR